jgi:DNA-binding transcriptional LysR family regulator
MDVRVLRLFVAVAEEGSIHAGARRMLTAQPALSQALRRLERELGGALFRHRAARATRGDRPSSERPHLFFTITG